MQERDIYEFTADEKSKAFDKIAQKYFVRNFGTMAKSDFETLLFSILIEHCLDNGLPYDDYSLSRKLGVTQSRIRNLKRTEKLKYPRGDKFKWKEIFAEEIKNARYDDTRKLVKMTIQDVNVLEELQHFLEENGWYYECQLNPKLFQCPADIFVLACNKLSAENLIIDEDTRQKIEMLAETNNPGETSAIRKFLASTADVAEDGLKELVKNISKDLFIEILKLLPFGGVAATAIGYLIKAIDR